MIDSCCSDLKTVLTCFRRTGNTEQMLALLREQDGKEWGGKKEQEEMFNLLSVYIDDRLDLLKEQKEDVTMRRCKAFDDLEEGGRIRGLEMGREEGREEARKQGIRNLVSSLEHLRVPREQVMQELKIQYSLTTTEAEAYLSC